MIFIVLFFLFALQGCCKQSISLVSYNKRPTVSFRFDQSFLTHVLWIDLLQKSIKQVFYARGYSVNYAEYALYSVECSDFLVSTIAEIQAEHDFINIGKFQSISCMISIKKGQKVILDNYHCIYENGVLEARDFLWKNRYERDTMKEICYVLAIQIEAVFFKYI